MYRHVRPDRVLILDLGDNGRGRARFGRYDLPGVEHMISGYPPLPHSVLGRFLDGLDTVFSVECPYNDALPHVCEQRGIRLVYHANPELWDERYRGDTTEIWVPTSWNAERIDGAEVVRMPVDRQRCAYRPRGEAARFLLPYGPAFHDRNGRELFLAAADHVRADVELCVGGLHPADAAHPRVAHLGEVENYWQLYDHADVLVLPRRYGGLSLCIQEAASCGLPIITLDLDPYRGEVHPAGLVPVSWCYGAKMRSRKYPVYACEPEALAATVDLLAGDPRLVAEMSAHSDRFAGTLDWRTHEDAWKARLHR